MSIKRFFPNTRPTLDLNFAATKRLDPRITYTRASTGTFVGSDGLIQGAAVNQARFEHNPTTGESLGLLVEEARTNLALYSEQINDASWAKQDATVTANSAVSPDGTTTADLIYPSTTGSIRYVNKSVGISSSITTMSFFVKASGFTRCYLLGGTTSLGAWFDLSAGTVGTVTANCSATIQAFANGWFRCSLTQPATTNPYISIGPCDANNSFVATASSTNGIFVWGAQLEAGSFPTSYIPTVASTVTRAADVASITGTNFSSWYNQSQGTLFCSFPTAKQDASGSTLSIVALNDNTDNEHVGISRNYDPLQLNVNIVTGYIAQSSFTFYPIPYGIKKVALGLAANNSICVVDGTTSAVDTSISMPSPNQLLLGTDTGYTNYALNGTIACLAFYPVRLPDAQLQALTAT